MNISSFLALKGLVRGLCFILIAWLYLGLPAKAEVMLSGQNIKDEIIHFMAEKGLTADPAINTDRLFKSCDKALSIKPLFNDFQTLEVKCPDKNGWKLAVRSRTSAGQQAQMPTDLSFDDLKAEMAERVVAAKSLKRGEIVSKDDVEIVSGPVSGFKDYFLRPEDVIGRKLKKPLAVGKMVRASYLETDWMIYKGQPVILESQIGSVQVLSEAIALENAQWGELARFLNIRSEQEVYATVFSEKKVVIGAKRF